MPEADESRNAWGPGSRAELPPLVLDLASREVLACGRDALLTRTEFEILAVLAESRGRAVTREELLLKVWGHTWFSESDNVSVHVHHIRRKLSAAGCDAANAIRTVRGVGYRLTGPVEVRDRFQGHSPRDAAGARVPIWDFMERAHAGSDSFVLVVWDDTIVFATGSVQGLLGWTLRQIVGASLHDMVHPGDVPPIRSALAVGHGLARWRMADGALLQATGRLVPLSEPLGPRVDAFMRWSAQRRLPEGP